MFYWKGEDRFPKRGVGFLIFGGRDGEGERWVDSEEVEK